MKELYLGLAICAFIVLVLTISVEVSTSGSYLNRKISNNKPKKNTPSIKKNTPSIKENNLDNAYPERVYNKNNLNKFFLEKYYKNNNYNPKNNFYLPN